MEDEMNKELKEALDILEKEKDAIWREMNRR